MKFFAKYSSLDIGKILIYAYFSKRENSSSSVFFSTDVSSAKVFIFNLLHALFNYFSILIKCYQIILKDKIILYKKLIWYKNLRN